MEEEALRGGKKTLMKVTIEITLNSFKRSRKKVKRAGAAISLVLTLLGGSYVAAAPGGHMPSVSVNWQIES